MILIRTEVAAYEGSCSIPISRKRRRRVAPLRGLVGVRAGGNGGRLDFLRVPRHTAKLALDYMAIKNPSAFVVHLEKARVSKP